MSTRRLTRKTVIIIDLLLILITLGALIYTIADVSNSNRLKTDYSETVIVEDGKVLSVDWYSTLTVDNPGKYIISSKAEGPDDIGFVSIISITDPNGKLINFISGDFFDSETLALDLSMGEYSIRTHRVSSQDEFYEYISQFTDDTTVEKEFTGFKDGEWHMNYEVALRRYLGNSAGTVIAISTVLGLLIAALFFLIIKTNDKVFSEYDERQELVRGRAFRYAYLSLFSYIVLTAVLSVMNINIPVEPTMLSLIGVGISDVILMTILILNDGYFALNESRKSLIVIIAIALLFNTFASINNIMSNAVIVNGILTESAINIEVVILLVYPLALLLVKSRLDNREDN